MTKKSSSSKQSRQPQTISIAGLILVAVLLILSQVTGIDLIAVLTGETPGAVTATPAPVTPPSGTAIASANSPFYVMFSAPTGSRDASTYVNGPDTVFAADLAATRQTLDVAAFELNSTAIANALLAAHNRGVRVRIVTDDEHGLDVSEYERYLAADEDEREDIALDWETPPEDTLLDDLYDAGIPIVDDDRSALMHNKFAIIDSTTVWTGSMNLTVNGSYRNNNNFVRIQSQRMVADYQTEFDEMFERAEFGPRSTADTPYSDFTVNSIPVSVYFAPEDGVIEHLVEQIDAAQRSVRFLAFSFTEDTLGDAFIRAGERGIDIAGVFETTGSMTQYSEMTRLFCAGMTVRRDGNPFILHHKVMIIDDQTVVIGSFNFSGSATESNDENLVIIRDASIAAQYMAEYNLRYNEGAAPEGITCN